MNKLQRCNILWRIIALALTILERLSRPPITLGFTIGPVTNKDRIQPQPHNMPIETSITNEQKVKVTLHPMSQGGNPEPIENPEWSVISGDSTLEVADDGLSAELISSDTPGDTLFMVQADAQIGDGTQEVQDTILCHVTGANAASLGMEVGTPEIKDQPKVKKTAKADSKEE